jgi:hypothetical protein
MSTTIIPGPNVFRAISGSLFSTAANWSRGFVPTGSDVAMIGDNCVIDITRTVGSLVVQPGFTASISGGLTLRVNDVINVLGQISCSGAPNIISFARKNIIRSLSPGTSTFTYTGSNQQSVAGGPYYNLTILGNAVRKSNANLITSGAVLINQFANLDLGPYDLDALSTVYMGAVSIGDGTLTKSQPGSIKIGGTLTIDTHASNVKGLDLSGNPTIELKGGMYVYNGSGQMYTGMGLCKFTTNNQLILTYSTLNFYNPVLISGSIAVSCSNGPIYLNNTISSVDSSSILYNIGTLYFNYQPSYDLITGSLNITSSIGNTIGYSFNGNATLPYTLYQNLRVYGIGTKTLKGNTIISGSLYVYNGYGDNINNTILELSSSNLIVSGTTNIGATNNRGTLSRIYNGTTTFLGPVILDVSNTNGPGIDFSASNADIEFRNGFGSYDPFAKMRTGTGSWYFTTNNQTLTSIGGAGITVDSKLIVSGSIALTSSAVLSVTNIINGTDLNSKFVNRGALYFATSASLNGSMTTGSYDFTSSANNVVIGGDYTATIPTKYSSSFYNLFISGQGTKSLAVDTYIAGNLRLETPTLSQGGMLDVSSSNLIVSGTTNTGIGVGVLRKSGPGKITFIGKLITYPNAIDFTTGNPTFEFQNGLQSVSSGGTLRLGSGTCSFTTNNQTIDITTYGDQRAVFKNILVSGSIAVTASSATYGWGYIHVTEGLNGTSPNSIFTIKFGANADTYLWYSGSQVPMQTGILEVSSSLNTFIYASGSQNVKGGTYYNLTFINGLKTLQGNVSVLGTFSTGSGATSGSYNLNGFTLTNP